jgi:hypothetical protein
VIKFISLTRIRPAELREGTVLRNVGNICLFESDVAAESDDTCGIFSQN